MRNKRWFVCQEAGCGHRRTYERVEGYLVVDGCDNCGDPTYSLEVVS